MIIIHIQELFRISEFVLRKYYDNKFYVEQRNV